MIVVLLAMSGLKSISLAQDWQPAFEDRFDRPMIGPAWIVARGDWHIDADRQLRIVRQWPSHSFLYSRIPLHGVNVRLTVDVSVPAKSKAGVYLQGGSIEWAGGGPDDRCGVELFGGMDAARGPMGRSHPFAAEPDKFHQVRITLIDGRYNVEVDGQTIGGGTVPQGRNLQHSGVQFSAIPDAVFDNVRIETAPMATPPAKLNVYTAAQNRAATVDATKFINHTKPDCGIMDAINALPPDGGVVLLPAGHFILRRTIELPSHVTLAGQGPRTILQPIDATGFKVISRETRSGVHRLTLEDGHDFKPGDTFGPWGHPATPERYGVTRLQVLEVQGNAITVNQSFDGKVIHHFFPAIASLESSYAHVRDLRILGPRNVPEGLKGGFQNNPITFGFVSNPRINRVVVENWPGDGVSFQTADDARVFDCDAVGVAQGFHPGTSTIRTIVARNRAYNNGSGVFFCWYNSNGIYLQNQLDAITGYPDAGDVFNTIAGNVLQKPMTITVGFNGLLFNNIMPRLDIFSAKGKQPQTADVLGPGGRTYGLPPRYFTIAHNTIDHINLYRYAQGNIIAHNRSLAGAKPTLEHRLTSELLDDAPSADDNLVVSEINGIEHMGLVELPRRDGPVATPAQVQPVLDGRSFYDPKSPNAGFQAALDQLGEQRRGTLQLPGGRYALDEPLRVPSGVTLAGHGSGTILLPRSATGTAIIVQAINATVRDLVIEGSFGRTAAAPAAQAALEVTGDRVTIDGVDIRGVAGAGMALGGKSVIVRDSRVADCGGEGYRIAGADGVVIQTSSAVRCAAGFVAAESANVVFLGSIAGLNMGHGFELAGNNSAVIACNAHDNAGDGIRIDKAAGNLIVANTVSGNNLNAAADGAGIRLGEATSNSRVLFNNCGDEKLYASQLVGIREAAGARGNEIRFNLTATLATRRGHENAPSLVTQGESTTANTNWTRTLLPSNDAIESIEHARQKAQ